MTYGADTLYDLAAYDHRPAPRKALPQNIFGNAALACVVLACGWIVYANLTGASADSVAAVRPATPMVEAAPIVQAAPMAQAVATVQASPAAAETTGAIQTIQTPRTIQTTRTEQAAAPVQAGETIPAAPAEPIFDVALLNSTYSLGHPPGTFSNAEPRQSVAAFTQAEVSTAQAVLPLPPSAVRQVALSIPLPPRRPSELGAPESRNPSLHAMAQRNKIRAITAEAEPTIFEKLFGRPQAFKPALAYAAPDGGVLGDGQSTTSGRAPPYDRLTAVYDISAHTVYMPDGTTLEAHSGLGNRLDDPRHVAERMRGATPPHVYDLTMRESLFHGVQALRLNPIGGEGNVFGRTGLLAHTYMLGPNGDSNGCVSFRNYNAFLHAYLNNKVKRLVVVARLP